MAKGKADAKKGDAKKGDAKKGDAKKGDAKKGDKGGDKEPKGAQQINVRHILVSKAS